MSVCVLLLSLCILLLIGCGLAVAFSPEIKETFAELTEQLKVNPKVLPLNLDSGVYTEWDSQLRYLHDNFGYGKPPGVLEIFPEQRGTACDSKGNLSVQDNVAFRPQRMGNGCSYIDMRSPFG